MDAVLGPAFEEVISTRQQLLDDPVQHLGMTGGRGWGPTKLYNLYDSPTCTLTGIEPLRAAHRALLDAVLRAYGWQELADAMADAPSGGWCFDHPWLDGSDRYVPTRAFRMAMIDALIELNERRYWEEIAFYVPIVEAALGRTSSEKTLLSKLGKEGVQISDVDLHATLIQGQRDGLFLRSGDGDTATWTKRPR